MSAQRYTEEFKVEAVNQVLDRGHSVAEVAQRLGVSQHSLYQWIKQRRQPVAEPQGQVPLRSSSRLWAPHRWAGAAAAGGEVSAEAPGVVALAEEAEASAVGALPENGDEQGRSHPQAPQTPFHSTSARRAALFRQDAARHRRVLYPLRGNAHRATARCNRRLT